MSGSSIIQERRVDGVVVLSMERGLKGEGEMVLREKIDALVAAGQRDILIDMARMPFVDSTELGRLIRSHISVRQAGGRVRLCNLAERAVTLMQMTGLDSVLEIYNTEAEALRNIRQQREDQSGNSTPKADEQ